MNESKNLQLALISYAALHYTKEFLKKLLNSVWSKIGNDELKYKMADVISDQYCKVCKNSVSKFFFSNLTL